MDPAPSSPPAATASASPNLDPAAAPPAPSTPALIVAMLRAFDTASDLIFSPGRAPQVERSGQLIEVQIPGVGKLTPASVQQIASDIMERSEFAARKLAEEGSADFSYSIAQVARFRVNVFRQRGSCAIVMRVIPNVIPTFASLNLPAQLAEIVELRNGIVLVTGPTGSGKSSTLAAIIDRINEEKAYHVLTIEDPIEFLHNHKKCTIHQRELYADTPSFALALRAALRQAPKVILVGEMRDRETMEIALEAAETGHLVFSTLHTIDASKTVECIIGAFPMDNRQAIRTRLGKAFRFIVSQRLIPRADGAGRIAAMEILKSTMRTREYVEKGETEGKSLLDAMRDGEVEGMQYFDGEIEKMIRAGTITMDVGLGFSTNPGNLRLELSDYVEPKPKLAPKKPAAPDLEIVR